MKYENMENEQLFELFKENNDELAVNILFERLFSYLTGYIKKYYSFNETDQEELISQTLVKFLNRNCKYDPKKARVITYVTTILKNTKYDFVNKKMKKNCLSLDKIIDYDSDKSFVDIIEEKYDFDSKSAKKEVLNSFLISIRNIKNENYKIALFLRLSLNMDQKEIAFITGRTLNTIKSDIKRGLNGFKNNLEEIYGNIDDVTLKFLEDNISDISLTKKDIETINDDTTRELLYNRFIKNYSYKKLNSVARLNNIELQNRINKGLKHIIDRGMTRKADNRLSELQVNEKMLNDLMELTSVFDTLPSIRKNNHSLSGRLVFILLKAVNELEAKTSSHSDFGNFLSAAADYTEISFDELCEKIAINENTLASYFNNSEFPDKEKCKLICMVFNIASKELTNLIKLTQKKQKIMEKFSYQTRNISNRHIEFKQQLKNKILSQINK